MRDFSVHRQTLPPSRKDPKLLFLIITLSIVTLAIFNFSPLSPTNNQLKTLQPTSKKITSTKELLEEIEKLLRNTGGTYSVYVYDLKKKVGFGINEEMILTAASVNKIPILAALYHLAGKGEIDLEKIIVLQREDIQDYGTGSIRYATPGTPYSLKTLARLLIEQSDNTAAYLLGNATLGLDKIQNLIDSWGLFQTNMTENKTSAKDMEILFIKIYLGEITTKALTQEMLGFMDKSDFDDRIPAGLPEGIKFYHKTGDEVGKIHDVGIIDLPKNPYYLGILTTDVTDEEKAKNNLAQISKLVYEFMSY